MAFQGVPDPRQKYSHVERDAATAAKRSDIFAFLGALNDQRLLVPSQFV